MQISAAAVVLVIAMLFLLALLVMYASGVGKRAHEAPEGVPTGNPAMERKVVVILGIMLLTGISLVGYGLLEPTRQATAAARQERLAIERGIENYTTLCMGCHGTAGGGAVVPDTNPPRVGPQLARADLQPKDPDEYKQRYDFVYKTIARGRPGTPMPAWGREDGGTLLAEEIHELTLMILKGDTELHGTTTVWQEASTVAREKIAHGSPEPQVPELELAADLSPEARAGAEIWKGKGACIGCHVVGGVGGQTGPGLSQIGSVAATRVPGQSAEEYIRVAILQPNAYIVPGYTPVMPSYQGVLTDAEVEQLVQYYMSLK